jgi:hypothetical protein
MVTTDSIWQQAAFSPAVFETFFFLPGISGFSVSVISDISEHSEYLYDEMASEVPGKLRKLRPNRGIHIIAGNGTR